MKIIEVLEYDSLYYKLKDQTIPIKVAYKLNKLFIAIQNEVSFYESSINQILSDYGQTGEDGQYILNPNKDGILIKPELIDECNKKVIELQNLEIEPPDISFTLDELECLKITPAELSCLFSLIKE